MSFMKTWVLLKMIRRGVWPDKKILNECEKFIEGYARKEGAGMKNCEYCNSMSDDLQPRHIKERGGTYTERAWKLCKKCRSHFITRKKLK